MQLYTKLYALIIFSSKILPIWHFKFIRTLYNLLKVLSIKRECSYSRERQNPDQITQIGKAVQLNAVQGFGLKLETFCIQDSEAKPHD